MTTITSHPYESTSDNLHCNHDYNPDGFDVDMCSLPREAHDHPCMHATRPHQHRDDGRLTVWARNRSWTAVVADDGTVCTRDVTPTPARYTADQVLGVFLTERDHKEHQDRAESTQSHK